MIKCRPLSGTSEEKLAYLNSLPYDVIVRRIDGRFHLLISELPVVSDGAELSAAHDELQRRKAALLRGLLEAGAEDEIERPRSFSGSTAGQLTRLAAKAVIICAIAGIAATMTAKVLYRQAGGLSISRLVKSNASILVSRAERFASAPAEVKTERLKKVRAVADELRPFVDEVRKAWEPKKGNR